jgi:AAA+ ATPase superfamily predicted ATPase
VARKRSRTPLLDLDAKERALCAGRKVLCEQMSAIQKKINNVDKQIGRLRAKRDRIKGREIVITPHALKRYKERVEDVDDETVKTNILNTRFKNIVTTLGDGEFPVHDNVVAVVRENTVVTIMIK